MAAAAVPGAGGRAVCRNPVAAAASRARSMNPGSVDRSRRRQDQRHWGVEGTKGWVR